jgi:anthranilate phosphoribosyltransferase
MEPSKMIKEGIAKLVEGQDLTRIEAEELMSEVMSGKATDAQIAAFLTALRIKVETVEEITAFASVMRKFCNNIHPKVAGPLVDVVGTGGDRIKTFNISTTAAFVAAGAGIYIAKHGNRSVTSRSGSADLLEALGLNLNMSPTSVEKSIEEVGMGFMYAPAFHSAMRYAVTPRREIGIRTVFNILGPLTNPANAEAQLLGVYDERLTEPLAHVLYGLGVKKAMVVHGLDGLDEISTIGQTKITLLKDGKISTSRMCPEDFGIRTAEKKLLEGSTPEESASITFKILNRQRSKSLVEGDPKRDIVLANAAATIYLGDKAETIAGGMQVARESIQSGSAYEKLKAMVKFSGGDMSKLEELEKHE